MINITDEGTHFIIIDTVTKEKQIKGKGNGIETIDDARASYEASIVYKTSPEKLLADSKASRISEVKSLCHNLIEAQYPYYKQFNINELQDYTAADKTEMWAFINAKRDRSNVIESEIEALTTIEDVNNYEITF